MAGWRQIPCIPAAGNGMPVTHASRQIRSKHSSANQSESLSLRWGSSGSDIVQVLAMVVETVLVIDYGKIRQKGYLSGLRKVLVPASGETEDNIPGPNSMGDLTTPATSASGAAEVETS